MPLQHWNIVTAMAWISYQSEELCAWIAAQRVTDMMVLSTMLGVKAFKGQIPGPRCDPKAAGDELIRALEASKFSAWGIATDADGRSEGDLVEIPSVEISFLKVDYSGNEFCLTRRPGTEAFRKQYRQVRVRAIDVIKEWPSGRKSTRGRKPKSYRREVDELADEILNHDGDPVEMCQPNWHCQADFEKKITETIEEKKMSYAESTVRKIAANALKRHRERKAEN